MVLVLGDKDRTVVLDNLEVLIYRHQLYKIKYYEGFLSKAVNECVAKNEIFESTVVTVTDTKGSVGCMGLFSVLIKVRNRFNLPTWITAMYEIHGRPYLLERCFTIPIRIYRQNKREKRRLALAMCSSRSSGWLGKMPHELLSQFIQ